MTNKQTTKPKITFLFILFTSFHNGFYYLNPAADEENKIKPYALH
jgi:hypothetical protein